MIPLDSNLGFAPRWQLSYVAIAQNLRNGCAISMVRVANDDEKEKHHRMVVKRFLRTRTSVSRRGGNYRKLL